MGPKSSRVVQHDARHSHPLLPAVVLSFPPEGHLVLRCLLRRPIITREAVPQLLGRARGNTGMLLFPFITPAKRELRHPTPSELLPHELFFGSVQQVTAGASSFFVTLLSLCYPRHRLAKPFPFFGVNATALRRSDMAVESSCISGNASA